MKTIKCVIKRKELDKILNEKNMTYRNLAKEIYIDQSYLTRLINGERYISDNLRSDMQSYLKVSFDDLFEQVEINRCKSTPEVTITKGEVNELMETGAKEVLVNGKKMNLKVVN